MEEQTPFPTVSKMGSSITKRVAWAGVKLAFQLWTAPRTCWSSVLSRADTFSSLLSFHFYTKEMISTFLKKKKKKRPPGWKWGWNTWKCWLQTQPTEPVGLPVLSPSGKMPQGPLSPPPHNLVLWGQSWLSCSAWQAQLGSCFKMSFICI